MNEHISASFYTAYVTTGHSPEPETWLYPARNSGALSDYSPPQHCNRVWGEYMWLPLYEIREGEYGITFDFHFQGLTYSFDETSYGFTYLKERYVKQIKNYYDALHGNYRD